MARVYLTTFGQYLDVREWRREIGRELGLDRPLPDNFIANMNDLGVSRLYPEMTAASSPLLRAFLWFLPAYPVLLVVSAFSSALLLIRRRTSPFIALAACAFFASLLLGPLYSNYVIPRYVLVSILFGYLVLAVSIGGAVGAWRSRPVERGEHLTLSS
jgi:hypothetical protein